MKLVDLLVRLSWPHSLVTYGRVSLPGLTDYLPHRWTYWRLHSLGVLKSTSVTWYCAVISKSLAKIGTMS